MAIPKAQLRAPYQYDYAKASDESGLECLDPSLTKQSFAEEADINTIVRRFNLTGQLPQGLRAPVYSDFEGIFDFHTAMNAVRDAQEAFMYMPADVRARFGNDPGAFVDFCSNPENKVEAERLGLTIPKSVTKAAVALEEVEPPLGGTPASKGAPAAASEAETPPKKGGKGGAAQSST